MENRAYAFAAGLFTLLLGAGVVVAALWLSGKTEPRVTYVLESHHPVTGLNVQAPVRFRGIEAGTVERIRLHPENPRIVLVDVSLYSRIPISRGTYAKLGSQGVTGLSYVMLDEKMTEKKPEPVPVGDPDLRIPVEPAFLDELVDLGRGLAEDVKEVARRVNTLLGEKNQAQLLRTLAGLETATNRVSELAVKIEPAFRNVPALTEDARKAFASADTMMKDVSRLTHQLAERLDTLERIAKSAEQVGGAAQSVSTAAVNETIPRIHVLLEDLGRTSRSLERLLADLNDEPTSIVFGRPSAAPGPGEPGFNPGRGASKR